MTEQASNQESILIPRINITDRVDHNSKKSKNKLKVLFGVLIFIGLIVVALGISTLNVYRNAVSFKDRVLLLRQLLAEQNIERIKEEIPNTKDSLKRLETSYLRIGFLSKTPYLGDFYDDGRHLLVVAGEAIEIGKITLELLEPYADLFGFSSPGSVDRDLNTQQRIDLAIKAIPSFVEKFDEISLRASRIKSELEQIDVNKYPDKIGDYEVKNLLREYLDQFDQVYMFIENAKPILDAAPRILGVERPQKYLVLFQNDKELRPTGGFITAYAIARVVNGKFEPVASDDIYNLDSRYKPHIKAPDPIVRYLKAPYTTSPYFRLRDLNWQPDFSDSMKIFLREAKSAGISDIDGVISVDTHVLVNILESLGPVFVPGFGEFSTKIVPKCNCPQVIYELESFADVEGAVVWSQDEPGKIIYAPPNYENRKKIIGPLMNSVVSYVLGQPKNKMPEIFEAVFRSITGKHILFYFIDEKIQEANEKFGTGGTFRSVADNLDFLAIVDANLGGRKSNLYLVQEVDQKIDIDKNGDFIKTLTVIYKNTEKQDGWLNSIMPNWVRIYVPKGSELISFDGIEVRGEVYEEYDRTVFSGSFQLRPLGVSKLVIKYKLPMRFDDYYRIFIQKQPGKGQVLHTFSIGNVEDEIFISSDKVVKIKI
jgi:hypothetical protein